MSKSRAAGDEAVSHPSIPRLPIRVFCSGLSGRFYATRAYRIDDKGLVTVTGEKFDVTNDIAGLIEQHNIEFLEKAGD